MATYVMLAQFTQQGINNIKNTAKRAEEFKLMASAHNVTVTEIFWTLGQYDVVVIVDARDEIAMAALSMSAGALGNARTQTLRILGDGDKDGPRQDGLTASPSIRFGGGVRTRITQGEPRGASGGGD